MNWKDRLKGTGPKPKRMVLVKGPNGQKMLVTEKEAAVVMEAMESYKIVGERVPAIGTEPEDAGGEDETP